MTVNEAKKLVEAAYPDLKAAYAYPTNGKYVFNMVDRKTGRIVYNSSMLTVDEQTKEVSTISVFSDNVESPNKNDIVYFCKEGMDMMNMKVI